MEENKQQEERMVSYVKQAYAKKEEEEIKRASAEGIFGLGLQFFYLAHNGKEPIDNSAVMDAYSMMEENVSNGCPEDEIPHRYFYLARKCFGKERVYSLSPTDSYFVLQDPEKGLKYLDMARKSGDEDANCFYGCLLATGLYVTKDPKAGMDIISEVRRKYFDCFYLVARILKKDGDEEGALEYYKMGYQRGDEHCAILLAQEYLFGSNKNEEEAFKILNCLNRGVQSNANVPYLISYCYAYGKGTDKDVAKAKNYYFMAYSPSYYCLVDINHDPLNVEKALKE